MSDEAERREEAYWVARLRAKGYTVQAGTGTGGIPFEPEVAFTPPDDRDCVEPLAGQSVAEPGPPLTSAASTATQMPGEADRREEPYWVAGLRAKGYTVTIGTGEGGISIEPEVVFTPPYELRDGFRGRVMSVLRKFWKGVTIFKRHATHPDRHAPLP